MMEMAALIQNPEQALAAAEKYILGHQQRVGSTKLAAAGKLWDDEDFASMKMDPFCKEIKESLQDQQTKQVVQIL